MKKCMGCMKDYEEDLMSCPFCGYEEGTAPQEVNHMEPGSILKGRYIVGKALGYGGFGVTYIGYDSELERRVAIKEYLPGEFSTRVPGNTRVTIYDGDREEQFKSGIEKFVDEAKRLAKFQNVKGVVPIYDSFLENETAYIVMGYIEGETLKQRVEREGKMDEEQALKAILPMVSALCQIHDEGIIHRDIAPDNIMISDNDEAFLIDFGASRFATSTHSKSLSVLIKPGYAPVEQYQSKGQQGTWTDVYALGATLYYLVTGVVPVDSMERLGNDDLKTPNKAGAGISKNLETSIMNAMNLKIEERTQSMKDFERELLSEDEVIRLATTVDKKDSGKIPRWIKIVTGMAAFFGCVFVALLLSGIIRFQPGSFKPLIVPAGNTIVPNVVNLDYDTAVENCSHRHLEPIILKSEYSDLIPQNMVVWQDIESGESVANGTVLNLYVSKGKETTLMPYIVGLNKDNAIVVLDEKKLNYSFEEIESLTAPGAVVSQSINENEVVEVGTTVLIQISKGISNVDKTREEYVPNLIDLEYSEAQKLLADMGIYIRVISYKQSAFTKNHIAEQSVAAGQKVHQGDTIDVIVSEGEKMVLMPYVQFETEQVALAMLAKEGLVGECTYAYDDTVPKGNVISQSEESGKSLVIGTKVELTISEGKKPDLHNSEGESKEEPKWSGWVTELPSNVSSDDYYIETRTEYEYKEREVTSSSQSTMQGWELYDTKKTYGTWGAWGEWSTTRAEESDTVQVQSAVQYRYRNTKENKSESAAEWKDDWTRDKIEPVDNKEYRIEVQTRTGTEKVCVGTERYQMGFYYKFINKNTGSWFWTYSWTYAKNNNDYSKCPEIIYYETDFPMTTTLPLPENNNEGHWAGINWYWYKETVSNDVYEDREYTEYRSRKVTYVYSPGNWSNWNLTKPSEAENREIASRDVYQSRTRTITTTYFFERWGATKYSYKKVENSSDIKVVKTKTEYRYKKKN